MSEEPGSQSVGRGARVRRRAKASAADIPGLSETRPETGGAETSVGTAFPAARPTASRAGRRATAAKPNATTVDKPAVLAEEAVASALAATKPAPETGRRIEATTVTITQGGAAEVEADSVRVERGGIGAASAEDIVVSSGGIGMAQADDIAVRLGGIGVARGERIATELGAIGLAVGGDVSVTQGFVRTVLAREVHIRQGGAGTVVANHVTMGKQTGTLVLLARKVEGDVRTVLDWRGALAAGAALGIVVGLLARRRQD